MGKRKLKDPDSFDLSSKFKVRGRINNTKETRLIIILENASLESVKTKRGLELLNSDAHETLLRKENKDHTEYRPDIVHQCLMMLLDSPLNRAGMLQVYVHTNKNVLIEVNPQTRIPRTFNRFGGVMVQLLHKFSVGSEEGKKLLKVIGNPVTKYLPLECLRIGTSFSSKKVVNPIDLVPKTGKPVAIVIGAMAHGQASPDYLEETVSISNYPLSAALTCTKICSAFEAAWNIL